MRIPFLFWNLKGLQLQELVAKLVREHDVAIIALVECAIDPAMLLSSLTANGVPGFSHPLSPTGTENDIKVFTRLSNSTLQHLYDDSNNHLTIRRLRVGSAPDVLLVVAHSQSKRNWSDKDQSQGAIRLARTIDDIERKHGHRRTILMGDLNMNPFEDGMVGSEGLHGVMTKRTARRGSRVVDGVDRPFFYNPMWRFFGERPDGPPGTHFYAAGGKPIAFFWHMFDQVLVRPELIDALSGVRIIDSVASTSLLDEDEQPDTNFASDHLPLLFSLEW